jgi:hypothetical protein
VNRLRASPAPGRSSPAADLKAGIALGGNVSHDTRFASPRRWAETSGARFEPVMMSPINFIFASQLLSSVEHKLDDPPPSDDDGYLTGNTVRNREPYVAQKKFFQTL